MHRDPPELSKSEPATLIESFRSLVEFWRSLDLEQPLQGDDGFSRTPDTEYLDQSPIGFRKFWMIAQSFPDAGLVGNGDELLCGRDSNYSWFDEGYIHLTEDTIASTIVGARSLEGRWGITRLSSGGIEDSELSVEEYLVSFGLLQLCEEPRKFNGSWVQANNLAKISSFLQPGSRCIWEADLWDKHLGVYFHDRGILWCLFGTEICVSARSSDAFRWFDENWWCEKPTEPTSLGLPMPDPPGS